MANDRFVCFKKKVPSREHIQRILENYLGGCGTVTEDHPYWWMVALPGKATSPFDGIPDGLRHPTFGNDERWIEVIFSRTKGRASVDVLTRAQDEFTHAVALGLARALARFYQADFDEDD